MTIIYKHRPLGKGTRAKKGGGLKINFLLIWI